MTDEVSRGELYREIGYIDVESIGSLCQIHCGDQYKLLLLGKTHSVRETGDVESPAASSNELHRGARDEQDARSSSDSLSSGRRARLNARKLRGAPLADCRGSRKRSKKATVSMYSSISSDEWSAGQSQRSSSKDSRGSRSKSTTTIKTPLADGRTSCKGITKASLSMYSSISSDEWCAGESQKSSSKESRGSRSESTTTKAQNLMSRTPRSKRSSSADSGKSGSRSSPSGSRSSSSGPESSSSSGSESSSKSGSRSSSSDSGKTRSARRSRSTGPRRSGSKGSEFVRLQSSWNQHPLANRCWKCARQFNNWTDLYDHAKCCARNKIRLGPLQ